LKGQADDRYGSRDRHTISRPGTTHLESQHAGANTATQGTLKTFKTLPS
jgi:hypothetical protein